MRNATGMLATIALAVGLAACGGGGGGGGSAIPSGFPADLPVYAGATLQSSSTSPHLIASWKTSDADSKVATFYNAQLNSGDWKIQDTAGPTTIDFTRKSDPKYGGTVTISNGTISVKMGPGCPC
jgi:hypothetical protein